MNKNVARIFLSCVSLFLLKGIAKSEVSVLTIPMSGSVEMAEVSLWGGYVNNHWKLVGTPPSYEAERILPTPGSSGVFIGRATVSNNSVSGLISDDKPWQVTLRGSSSANYSMDLFAEVEPDNKIRVKFQGNTSVTWLGPGMDDRASFLFDALSGEDKGGGVNRNSISPLVTNWTLSQSSQCSAAVLAPASTRYDLNGKKYYKLGTFYLNGFGGIPSQDNVTLSAAYTASIGGIDAHYRGNYLAIKDGNTQIGLVNKELKKPLRVTVSDGETGVLASSVAITFSLIEPSYGARFSNGQVTITTSTINGVAAASLTLGVSTTVYTVKASCPASVCVSGAKEVIFTEKAVSDALNCVSCQWTGTVGKKLPTPFRLKVIDQETYKPVAGAAVSYEVVKFTDRDGNTGSEIHGAKVQAMNPVTDIYGFSRGYLTLGSKEGTYVVRAQCPTCLSKQEDIAYGIAQKYDIIIGSDGVTAGDPGANGEDCPSGCCPLTPVLRMKRIMPNDGVSFTSDNAENLIGLSAKAFPECLNNSTNVTWQVADAPGDFINSGTPAQPTPGEVSSFRVFNDILPEATEGRALPLAYKVTASVTYSGITRYANATIKQDEIDKCRQEYIDLSRPGNDLTSDEYFPRYNRTKFTIGVDGAIDPDYVRFIDCYAHIYPDRAQEVESLRTNPNIAFSIDVNSGYRSPRKNWIQRPQGKWNSVHQFGGGVDIVPKTMTAQNKAERFKALWYNTSCPKILETGSAEVMAVCDIGQSTSTYKRGYSESNVFGLANCLHLGD